VHVTLGGEEAIMPCPHFCKGIRDKVGFWKVISMPEDVGESKRVGGK